ncbi:hypothetical protein CYMTET_10498 [Cymbomonas tetramitiformis]|uniref:Peptidase S53 domain-containing protein n=1 Tax=Cymbomonas tetramitiformis TaxID=36881 RepID=A0AAE0LDZ2_9CHLO|nr:hypothetical protein CYMTET_10498 [Cymbomonas tetramitiformis]
MQEDPHPDDQVVLIFAIKQNTEAILEKLEQVSNPNSSTYGHHLSLQEVKELAENKDASSKVHSFVGNHAVLSSLLHPAGDFLRVNLTVFHANKMLDATFQKFYNHRTRTTALRTKKYSLPEEIAMSIDLIVNALHLPATHEKPEFHTIESEVGRTSRNATRAGAEAKKALLGSKSYGVGSGLAFPDLIFKYYGIDDRTLHHENSSIGFFETNSQYYIPEDLTKFSSEYGLQTPNIEKVVGVNVPEMCKGDPKSCDEASLDLQIGLCAIERARTTVYSIPASFDAFLSWASSLTTDEDPPKVHSISYLWGEGYVPQADARRFDIEVGKLGLRGITVISVSGDDGAPGYEARGKMTSDPGLCAVKSVFPGGCPHLTIVGATMGPEKGSKTEVVCQADKGGTITSGGGFSVVFDRPKWQEDVVTYYLTKPENLPTKDTTYKSTGRGYPDVSLLGAHFPVYINGNMFDISGTSGSAPLFAAMIVLINDARMQLGKPPLGFLNQLLYLMSASNPDVFYDVVEGNTECTMEGCCPGVGFKAAKGWDAATGLGTVNFKAFKKAAVEV